MINLTAPILIVGAGSIGERHIRNLWMLGYKNLHVYRQRNLPFRDIGEAKVNVFTEWNQIDTIQPFAAFITSPTSQHLSQSISCAEKGIHLFIEKPLSHSLVDIDRLKAEIRKTGVYVKIGYMMRFHPIMKQIKKIVEEKTYGNLLSFHSHWGEYLPDWHPWEDYRTSYAAKKELGGGAALTLSHDLDLANWLPGSSLAEYKGISNYACSLEVNVNSGADFLLKYKNGVTGHVHLNFYEKIPRRVYSYIFEDAIIDFDYFKSEIKISTKKQIDSEKHEQFDRNNLFMDQTKEFFSSINSFTGDDPLNNINESEVIIKMCESCD
jgi:predicted dehydrogenase